MLCQESTKHSRTDFDQRELLYNFRRDSERWIGRLKTIGQPNRSDAHQFSFNHQPRNDFGTALYTYNTSYEASNSFYFLVTQACVLFCCDLDKSETCVLVSASFE